jgi:hypothetical protein
VPFCDGQHRARRNIEAKFTSAPTARLSTLLCGVKECVRDTAERKRTSSRLFRDGTKTNNSSNRLDGRDVDLRLELHLTARAVAGLAS